ncbi:MAG: ATP-binding cassette domain-containing protein [Promethearchaeota archaeon]
MDKNIIETFDLTKFYKLRGGKKAIRALNNVNISVKKGEIFGLLGPNGAGKTTMIQILTTLIQPTSGYALIDGYNILKNPLKVQDKIALMLSSKMIYYRITAYDNLKYFCKLYNVSNYKEKINNTVQEFGLKKWLNQYVEKFSSGMKMKLALCRTFLLERDILFLDEPTVGVDVETVSFIVDKIKNSDYTIFLTSHDMSVVEKLCNRIAFLNKGNVLKIGTKDDIKKYIQTEITIEIELIKNKNELLSELKEQDFITNVQENKKNITISLLNRIYYKDLLNIIRRYDILKIKELEMSLEDLFLKLIKK